MSPSRTLAASTSALLGAALLGAALLLPGCWGRGIEYEGGQPQDTNPPDTTECGEDWTGCDEWPHPGDCESADTGEPAEDSSEQTTTAGTRSGALRGLGVLLVGKVFGAALVRQEHRDIVGSEAHGLQLGDDALGVAMIIGDAEYGSRHGDSLVSGKRFGRRLKMISER